MNEDGNEELFVLIGFFLLNSSDINELKRKLREICNVEEFENEKKLLRAKIRKIMKASKQTKIIEKIYPIIEEPPKKVEIKIDENAKFFRMSKLNEDEIDFLLRKNYVISEQRSICTERKEKFLLKPRFNEGLTHHFVVYDISEYLNKRVLKFLIMLL